MATTNCSSRLDYTECLEEHHSVTDGSDHDLGYHFANCVVYYCDWNFTCDGTTMTICDDDDAVNATGMQCPNISNVVYHYEPVQELMCEVTLDFVLGVVHLIVGVLGIVFNTIALAVFIRLGFIKPYYIIIIFETLTDLIVCFVALYTGIFLLSDRSDSFNTPLCYVAGWLWNWNMVTTPLLLCVAGLLRIRAVYLPHDHSFLSSKLFITGICVGMYVYGAIFACYPYFFNNVQYYFYEWWSICDFVYDEADHKQSLIYSLVLGPIPMCLSLLVIIVTNIIIARYLFKRYKKSWENNAAANGRVKDNETSQSKQVVLSLFLMTLWYLLCYSIIIFHNFKNLLVNVLPNSDVNFVISDLSNLGQTYFYAAYNFCAYLNSFVNPLIQLISGNTFKAELRKMKLTLAMQIKTVISHSGDEGAGQNNPPPSKAGHSGIQPGNSCATAPPGNTCPVRQPAYLLHGHGPCDDSRM